MNNDFAVLLRGWDREQVDRVLGQVGQALASGSETARAEARRLLAETEFDTVLRGYDRTQVQATVQELQRRLA